MDPTKFLHPAMQRLYEAAIALGKINPEARQSSLAALLNTSPQTVNNWERRGPSREARLLCQSLLGINAVWIETGTGEMLMDQSPPYAYTVKESPSSYTALAAEPRETKERDPGGEFIAIRRVRIKASAGITGFAIEPLNGDGLPIFFRADWLTAKRLRANKLLAVRVNGPSMQPGLFDGDLVVINTEDSVPKDGEVFVINYEGEAVIKRLKRDAGQWWLSSDNADKVRFPDKLCDENASLIGRVIYKQSEHI